MLYRSSNNDGLKVRFGLRGASVVLASCLAAACSGHSEGPSPSIHAASGQLAVDPGIVCRAQFDSKITLHGSGFAPMPIDLLNEARVALPSIELVGSSATGRVGERTHLVFGGDPEQPNASLVSFRDQTRLTFTIDRHVALDDQTRGEVPVGLYDVSVKNPSGTQSNLAVRALAVVDAPILQKVNPGIVCLAQGARTLTLEGSTLLEIDGQRAQLQLEAMAQALPITALDDCVEFDHAQLTAKSCSKASLSLESESVPVGYPRITLQNPPTAACTSEQALNLRIVPAPSITRVTPALGCTSRTEFQFKAEGSGFLEIDGRLPLVKLGDVAVSAQLEDCQDLAATGHTLRTCSSLSFTSPVAGLPTGSVELVVTNPEPAGCSTSSVTALTLAPPPVISELRTPLVCLGSSPRSVEIVGSGFLSVDGVVPAVRIGDKSFPSASITPADCAPLETFGMNVQRCARLGVSVSASDLASGTWAVSVTNPDPARCEDTKPDRLTVIPGPTLASAQPALACSNGAAAQITLSGTNFLQIGSEPPKVSLDGIPADVQAISNCSAVPGQPGVSQCTTLDVTAPEGALLPGRPKIVVTNPEPIGCDAISDTLVTVPPALAIVSASPSNLCVNAPTTPVTITGTGLLQSAGTDFAVTVNGKAYIPTEPPRCTALSDSHASGTSVCTDFTFLFNPATAIPGDVPISVLNPTPNACQISTLAAFRVVETPSIDRVTPAETCSDVPDTAFTLVGSEFAVGADVTALNRETGVLTAAVATTQSARELELNFPYGLASGSYDLTVSNAQGCSKTFERAFSVRATPNAFWIDPAVVYQGTETRVTIFTSGLSAKAESVELVDASGVATPLPSETPLKPNRILARVPSGLTAGKYDLRIRSSNGCTGRLAGGLTVSGSRSLALSQIEPAVLSPTQATHVTLSATQPLPAGFMGFQGQPWVYLRPSGTSDAGVALRGVTGVDTNTLKAIVPENTQPGTYDVIAVNPSGEVGILPSGVTVAVSEPPLITSVTPNTIVAANGATATIGGKNFEVAGTTSVSLSCRDLANLETVVSTQVLSVTNTSLSFMVPAAPSSNTSCALRLTSPNGASANYAAISFRATDGELSIWKRADSALNEARRGLALVAARPEPTSRYLYALGGDNGSVSLSATPFSRGTPKTSVEAAQIATHGELGPWKPQLNTLPSARTQAGAVAIGRFIYLVGGHDGGSATRTLLRAQVLDPAAAPRIVDVDAELGDTIRGVSGGRWQYRVAAVYPDDDPNNPAGQSLPGELLTLELPSNPNRILLKLTWPRIANESKYRLYRSTAAGQELALLAKENRISCGASECQFIDDGTLDTNAAELPLPAGSLGKWHTLAATLNTAREGLAVTAVADPQLTTRWYLYAFGGRNGAGAEQASYEWARIDLDAASGNQTVSAFTTATKSIGKAKSDLAAWVVDKTSMGFLSLSSRVYVYVGAGSSASVPTDELAHGYLPGNAGGELVSSNALALDLESLSQKALAAGSGATGNWLYLFGGIQSGAQSASHAAWAKLDPGASNPSSPVLSSSWFAGDHSPLNTARAFLGSAQEGGYFFVAGGYVSTSEPAARSVEYAIR